MTARGGGRLPPWTVPAAGALATIAGLVLAALLIAPSLSWNVYALRPSARGGLVAIGLFVVSGEALSWAAVPRAWGVTGRLMALPLGAAVSGLVLTALGLAHVPLRISEWLLIVGGAGASLLVHRRHRRSSQEVSGGARPGSRWRWLCWLAALAVVGAVALAPAARTGLTTIYGQNPDAHQVVGIATLFQHVSPTGTDISLPIDTVPPNWRFRYPIFYGLAAVSSLGHLDPIRAFPVMAALLLICLALGFGAFAVLCLGAPGWSGPVIGVAVALATNTLHLVWHPYWNQLWGLAMFPWALVTGWRAVVDKSRAAAALFGLMLLVLALAYPLALPYPVLIIGALALAYRRHRLVRRRIGRSGLMGVVGVVILAPAVAGAALKLGQGIVQLFSGNNALWGGDVTRDLPFGGFVGVGGGALPALLVLVVALAAVTRLPRRDALALGISLLALLLLDLRFRLASRGAYIDFKYLSFVGALVLALAGTGVARLGGDGLARLRAGGVTARGARSAWAAVAGSAVLMVVWAGFAVRQSHAELQATNPQVDLAMLEIRTWAHELPHGASVRVDIPPSGLALWAVYMLGDHPVDTPTQVLGTTYAVAPYGTRASYSLSLRYLPGTVRPTPRPAFAVDPPVASNTEYILRKVKWPARLDSVPETASPVLIEP